MPNSTPVPSNELERLETLYRYEILNTPPEPAFDDLALLAAQICQTPIALISLVDEERQWFKACVGLGVSETPRDQSFCSYAIMQPQELFVVHDALVDERFCANPLVTEEPHIRFYAAAALVTPEGQVLGNLCVIDRIPRQLTPGQVSALQALCRSVVGELELRRHVKLLGDALIERDQAQAALQYANAELERRVQHRTVELQQLYQQLRTQALRQGQVETNERRALARELHDRVGQNLTALDINLAILRDSLSPEQAIRLGPRLEDSQQLVQATEQHIRDVLAELRPPDLDDYGLMAALRSYVQRYSRSTGLPIWVSGQEPQPRLTRKVETELFRIAQEALANAAKHARATEVWVRLTPLNQGVRLVVEDNGIGFDPAVPAPNANKPAWGLVCMRERAEMIGGRLRVESNPGHWTRVTVELGECRHD